MQSKILEKEEADTICAKISPTLQNSNSPKDNLSKDEHQASYISLLNQLYFYQLTKVDLLLSLNVRTIWKKLWII